MKMPLFVYLRPSQPGRSSCNLIFKLNFHKSYLVNFRILTFCGPVYNICFCLREGLGEFCSLLRAFSYIAYVHHFRIETDIRKDSKTVCVVPGIYVTLFPAPCAGSTQASCMPEAIRL